MDSLTQLALGAAVGEATLGHRVGYRAVAWGAFFGTLPDLDVLSAPFMNEVDQLITHRGISHSFFLAAVAAPTLGWCLHRLHKKRVSGARFRDWSLLVLLCMVTHVLLDFLTMYGTQLFAPFSNYPAAIGSIFIIDLFFTIPLITGTIVALAYPVASHRRRLANNLGLGISTFYLALGLFARAHAGDVASASLRDQSIEHARVFANPSPLNIVLWNIIADAPHEDALYVGNYSLLDDDRDIRFRRVYKNSGIIANHRNDIAVERLLWFSRGYYVVRRESESVYFSDIRFSRNDLWLTESGDFIFDFQLIADDGGAYVDIRRATPAYVADSATLNRLWRRLLGDEDVAIE